MIKTIVAFSLAPGIREADFEAWYYGPHMALLKKIPGLRRVTTGKVIESPESRPGFQYVAEMFFDDLETYLRTRESEEFQAARADGRKHPEYLVEPRRHWLEIVDDASLHRA